MIQVGKGKYRQSPDGTIAGVLARGGTMEGVKEDEYIST